MPVVLLAVEVANAVSEISPQWALIVSAFFMGAAALVKAWIGPRRYREEIAVMQTKLDHQTALIDQVVRENSALRIENAQRRGFEQVFVSVIEQQNKTITNLWNENKGYRADLGLHTADDDKPPIVAPPVAPASVEIPSTIVQTAIKPPRAKRKPKEKPDEPDS